MTNQEPLISVIVPAYNIEEYLERCVRSILEQTYTHLEILLVDDGSTDATAALCDGLAGQDERIRVFHKENGGSSSARNLGIENAGGMYIGFVDADDYIDKDMYRLLWQAMSQRNALIAQVGRDEIDESGSRLPDICHPPEREEYVDDTVFLRELLMHRGDCSFCTKLLHRDLLKSKRFPVGVLNEDFHLMLQLLPFIPGVVSIPKQCYHVFYRRGSNTRVEEENCFSRVYADNVDNADLAAQLVEREYPQYTEEALRFGCVQRLDYMLHIPVSQMGKSNPTYTKILGWLRKNWRRAMGNPYLTAKNKLYLTLLAICPAQIRRLHRKWKGMKPGKGRILEKS